MSHVLKINNLQIVLHELKSFHIQIELKQNFRYHDTKITIDTSIRYLFQMILTYIMKIQMFLLQFFDSSHYLFYE